MIDAHVQAADFERCVLGRSPALAPLLEQSNIVPGAGLVLGPAVSLVGIELASGEDDMGVKVFRVLLVARFGIMDRNIGSHADVDTIRLNPVAKQGGTFGRVEFMWEGKN